MPHWRKPYKQAAPLGRPDMLAHAGGVTAGPHRRQDGPSWLRIMLGLVCWIIVIGTLYVAHRVF